MMSAKTTPYCAQLYNCDFFYYMCQLVHLCREEYVITFDTLYIDGYFFRKDCVSRGRLTFVFFTMNFCNRKGIPIYTFNETISLIMKSVSDVGGIY